MAVGALLLACAVTIGALILTGSPRRARPASPFRFFAADSFWNRPLPASAPVDPDSGEMIAGLMREVTREEQAGNGPWIDTTTDGVPILTVPGDQPTVRVELEEQAGSGPLAQAWSAVPLPSTARPSEGEHDLVVWQPSTDRMWEFFKLIRVDGRWRAEWGGAMQRVSRDPGVYGPGAWSGAEAYWGVTACSLPLVGGAITVPQLEAGSIDHALALAVPDTRAGVYAAPARRTDGKFASPAAIPEGARLRLDPSLDLSKLNMPPLTRMIAHAAQRYGLIVRDTGGVVAFFGQPAPPGSDVYAKLYNGLYTNQLMAAFPWRDLRVVKMDLRRVG